MGGVGTGLLAFQGRQAEPTTVVPTRRVRSLVPESPRFRARCSTSGSAPVFFNERELR